MARAKVFYAFRCVRSNPSIKTLVEIIGKRELRAAQVDPRYIYELVDGITAHKWVRNGLLHETALYVADNDRVRRAKGDSTT